MAKKKNKGNDKKKCYSGSQRWRPGSVIPIGFCERPDWFPGVQKAVNEWNSRFGYVSLNAVLCVPFQTSGGIAIMARSIWAGGEAHHGSSAPETDGYGYIYRATISVNTIDYYPADQVPNGSSPIIAHEAGHCLGAGHTYDDSDNGCMERPVVPTDPDYPGSVTLAYLNDIYSQPEICRNTKKH